MTITTQSPYCAPPWSASGCLISLSFQTTLGQAYTCWYCPLPLPTTYQYTIGPGHNRWFRLRATGRQHLTTTPFPSISRYRLLSIYINQTSLGDLVGSGEAIHWITTFTAFPTFNDYRTITDLRGSEVGYPPATPMLDSPARILLATLILCIPLLLMHRRRYAANTNRRPS
jgi:hypothetical protein